MFDFRTVFSIASRPFAKSEPQASLFTGPFFSSIVFSFLFSAWAKLRTLSAIKRKEKKESEGRW
jgi:hypothetical protein